MNLHTLSLDPRMTATYLDDTRVGKMLMETNQMMSLAVKFHGAVPDEDIGDGRVCRGSAHLNHPVSIWVRRTSGNFGHALRYANALSDEFIHRFGKTHASAHRIEWIAKYSCHIPEGPLEPFPNCARHQSLELDFTHLPVMEAYRAYMIHRWQSAARPPKWSNRSIPDFIPIKLAK